MATCRAALREGSYTFFAASLMLPKSVREPASALYAFCRLADDAVDNGRDKTAAVAHLRQRVHAAYAGTPHSHAVDRALAAIVQHYAIPQLAFDALLEGFEWDAAEKQYETLEDLSAYAARVAGTVGAMMALLMGVRTTEGVARACELGVAMQFSNIARDVGEDARMGRIYLPLQWLREEGIDPVAWLSKPEFNSGVASVVRRLLAAAEVLYARVDSGVAELPLPCRPGINAARYLYAQIGCEVARRGLDSVSQRAVVAPTRKAYWLAHALVRLWPARPAIALPALPAIGFLVDAAVASELPQALRPKESRARTVSTKAGVEDRAVWVIELFERLERQERAGFSGNRTLTRTG
jgi:phytoene synthase